jgi:hypothetical protein
VDVGLALESVGSAETNAEIVLSHELVGLLSAQLYQSPIKAIEELVVNSYDADAKACWVWLSEDRILVLDDGTGMDVAGIQDLWHVGHSSKRDEQVEKARSRRQIGKFGIGKLATAAIANRVTYITKAAGASSDQVLTTSVDYREFAPSSSGGAPVSLKVRRVTLQDILDQPNVQDDLTSAGVEVGRLADAADGWTLVLLEDLKKDASALQQGRLKWVLSTAMPLVAGFSLFLQAEKVQSSKESADRVVEFQLEELSPERLTNLSKGTGETWVAVAGKGIESPTFPNGIAGEAFVSKTSLFGKSDDLSRSHGFFVRVRGRLINLDDPLFGLKPSTHSILNRFHCVIDADDLDEVLTAPRESVELSPTRSKFIAVLNEIFNQARSGYESWERAKNGPDKSREHERNYVNPRLVERPIADALLGAAESAARDNADRRDRGNILATTDHTESDETAETNVNQDVAQAGWYYLQLPLDFDLSDLTASLYSDERDDAYKYERTALGRSEPMVRLDPTKSTFFLNTDHDLVRAHDDSPAAQKLLEDVVTAEALLEVYLREQGLGAQGVEEVLSRRDELMRSLTKDRVYSLSAIANDLRDSAAVELDLEIQQVVAARALGFLARHIGGSSEPDGVARLPRQGDAEIKITLEAKSSGKVVAGLSAIGFDALQQHMKDQGAVGCLLVAPGYPGASLGENSAAAKRAGNTQVSCWTVNQLARVVENAEKHHITATKVLEIVTTAFTPDQVEHAVNALMDQQGYADEDLYRAIMTALRGLESQMRGTPRTADIITSRVSINPAFETIEAPVVAQALRDLSGASRGAMHYEAEGRVVVHTTLDELERRVGSLLGGPGAPRHSGLFRDQEAI